MDVTDLRIIRAMGLRPFETWPRDPERFRPGYLGEACGVSPETVKTRLQRMQAEGILTGYEIYPNVRHFGLKQTSFHLHLPQERKARAQEDLKPLDGLVGLYDFLGPDLCVDLCYRDDADLKRKLQLISRLTDQQRIVGFYERAMPTPNRALISLDWRIVKALRGNARRPLEEVAAELGVSTRTVRRRFDQMQRLGDVDTVAVVDLGRIPDVRIFNLVFYLDDPQDKQAMAAIRKEFDASFLLAWQPPSADFGSFHTAQFANSNEEMEAIRRRGAALPGVSRAEISIPCGAYYHGEWLDEAIAARIEA